MSPLAQGERGSGGIIVVCPNPALDRLQVVDDLRPGAVNRATEVVSRAGGKGLVVARGVRRLGADVDLYGFAGGVIGDRIRAGCLEIGVGDHHVQVAGETRITPVIIEATTGRSTVVNEPGPQIRDNEVDQLLEKLAAGVEAGGVVVSTGSLPPGVPTNFHAQVAAMAARRGADTVVDADGPPLQAAAEGPLGLLKSNLAEFSQLMGEDLNEVDERRVLDAARRLLRTGIAAVVVTLGARGALYVDAATALFARSPAVHTRNPTGSGDMFLAGLVVARARGDGVADALRLAVASGAANAANLEPDIDPDVVAGLAVDVIVEVLAEGDPAGRP